VILYFVVTHSLLRSIRVTRVNNQSVRDVWTADLRDSRLVLGMFDLCLLSYNY